MYGTLTINEAGRQWVTFDLQDIYGTGRINPCLHLAFKAQPVANSEVILDDVTVRLEHRAELIGEGRVVGDEIRYSYSTVNVEVLVTERMLRYITGSLASTATTLDLNARLRGVVRGKINTASASSHRLTNDPEPGEWRRFLVSSGNATKLEIPRGQWFERVLAATRNEQYRYLEVALPRDDDALRGEWNTAVDRLMDAERAYGSGDDVAVFLHFRGALDALPGAKQQILADISDEQKRANLDELLKRAGLLLHHGRHVAADGEDVGTFPVDHIDAAFVLDLMRVLLSHLSLMLSSDRRRASA